MSSALSKYADQGSGVRSIDGRLEMAASSCGPVIPAAAPSCPAAAPAAACCGVSSSGMVAVSAESASVQVQGFERDHMYAGPTETSYRRQAAASSILQGKFVHGSNSSLCRTCGGTGNPVYLVFVITCSQFRAVQTTRHDTSSRGGMLAGGGIDFS